jgi:hypothetical protein
MEFKVGDRVVSFEKLAYGRARTPRRVDITSRDIVAEIRKTVPDFSPCAYLNGTEKADSLKWLLTTYLGTRSEVLGYVGPRFMELAQSLHHVRTGPCCAGGGASPPPPGPWMRGCGARPSGTCSGDFAIPPAPSPGSTSSPS